MGLTRVNLINYELIKYKEDNVMLTKKQKVFLVVGLLFGCTFIWLGGYFYAKAEDDIKQALSILFGTEQSETVMEDTDKVVAAPKPSVIPDDGKVWFTNNDHFKEVIPADEYALWVESIPESIMEKYPNLTFVVYSTNNLIIAENDGLTISFVKMYRRWMYVEGIY